MEDFFKLLWFCARVVTLTAVAFLFVALTCVAAADGKADYCYILSSASHSREGSVVTYDLIRHRPWRFDRTVDEDIKTFDEAVASAQKINCELR